MTEDRLPTYECLSQWAANTRTAEDGHSVYANIAIKTNMYINSCTNRYILSKVQGYKVAGREAACHRHSAGPPHDVMLSKIQYY